MKGKCERIVRVEENTLDHTGHTGHFNPTIVLEKKKKYKKSLKFIYSSRNERPD